eukprot:m.160547 g.160547  ORF g.160547 m.160547 type:complete len:305 (+) comp16504_c0_seq3:218-1132(+)
MARLETILNLLHSDDLPGLRDVISPLPRESQQALLTPQGKDNTPLHHACQRGAEEITRFILADCQGNPNIRGPSTVTPLMLAARNGFASVVKLLLQHGANVRARDKNLTTPLLLACRYGFYDVLCELLSHEPQPKLDPADKDGLTPIMAAAPLQDQRLLARLVEAGARIDDPDPVNTTPLHAAVVWSRFDSVKLLLRSGAKVSTRGVTGYQPLHLAVQVGNIRMVRLLIASGADASSRSTAGLDILALSEQSAQPKLHAWLLEAKAVQELFLALALLEMAEPTQAPSVEMMVGLRYMFLTGERL